MVEVTQADRDAAASGYYAWIGPNPRIPEKMVDGNADDHSIAQAFARHREAAVTTAQAEADALRAEVERLSYDGIHTCHDSCPRLPCVQRREIERLREVLEMLAPSLDYLPHPQCVEAIDAVRAALSEPMP